MKKLGTMCTSSRIYDYHAHFIYEWQSNYLSYIQHRHTKGDQSFHHPHSLSSSSSVNRKQYALGLSHSVGGSGKCARVVLACCVAASSLVTSLASSSAFVKSESEGAAS